jgi:tetratricopeptide (TPR) repeat protein
MDDGISFAGYIPRDEQEQIRQEAAQVAFDGHSRTVLLYGPGGIGKTTVVRELARTGASDSSTVWLEPIDLDDSEFWLLSNLERRVAEGLDPNRRYFARYLNSLSRLPRYGRRRIDHQTLVSHLGRVKRVFVECYAAFIQESGKSVVIALDTVEATRGTYFLLTLTQWMKMLPGTLFILSGRPMTAGTDGRDPIKSQLEDPHLSLPVKTIHLAELTHGAALEYLDKSAVASALTAEEKEKLVHLTRGHPLWLALAIDYLVAVGVPQEMEIKSLTELQREAPYRGEMSRKGQGWHEAFKRRLVTPYRETDFWHEAMKRLAVVRQSINYPIWRDLMSDYPLPEDIARPEDAWGRMLQTPWVRRRANSRYVTLHDALAEELAERIIPLHDQDETWRRSLWGRTAEIYGELTAVRELEMDRRLTGLYEQLHVAMETGLDDLQEREDALTEGALMEEVAQLDVDKRELDQLKIAGLYYRLLSDFEAGCEQFLSLFKQASDDVLLQELVCLEMQRFLPDEAHTESLSDVTRGTMAEFRGWLLWIRPDLYIETGVSIAGHLIDNEQAESALELLDKLPAEVDWEQRYRSSNQRGNALMRIPGRVGGAEQQFRQALQHALDRPSVGGEKLVAEGYKELGFYYRNTGRWSDADQAYRQARDAILPTISSHSPKKHREELASILTNWAYVKALLGFYHEAKDLVESAVTIRRRLGEKKGEGISLSVSGEVYRLDEKFEQAWESYREAERIFHETKNAAWLGLLYQEQAICLFQASGRGLDLAPDSYGQARRRILLSLDICRDNAVRYYPSALNRAGRIFGESEFHRGLPFLDEGIDEARKVADGWFYCANLIEYVELCYKGWIQTEEPEYRQRIIDRQRDISQANDEYNFPDLEGRWKLVQGHLGIHDALATGDESRLTDALEHYIDGFVLIAKGYAGSHGSAAIPMEFRKFNQLLQGLRPETRKDWRNKLRRAWSDPALGHIESTAQTTSLLARLEELEEDLEEALEEELE